MRYVLPIILLLAFVCTVNAQCADGTCQMQTKQAEPLFPLVAESFPVASTVVGRVRPVVLVPNAVSRVHVVVQRQPVRSAIRRPLVRIRALFCR